MNDVVVRIHPDGQKRKEKIMKYRVKFRCYWYNTGEGDNHYYTNYEDFDTLEEAKSFKTRVDNQKDNIEHTIEIENGFIDDYGEIVKFYPEREEKI